MRIGKPLQFRIPRGFRANPKERPIDATMTVILGTPHAGKPLFLDLNFSGSKENDQTLREVFQIAWGAVLGVFAASDCVRFGLIDTSISTKRATCIIALDDTIPVCQIMRETRICQESALKSLESIIITQQLPSIGVPVSLLYLLMDERYLILTVCRSFEQCSMPISKGW